MVGLRAGRAAAFSRLAQTGKEKELGLWVSVLYSKFKALGDDIVALVDQRRQMRLRFTKDVKAMDVLIDDDLDAAIGKAGAEAAKKRQTALGMEVYIFEAFTAIEGYMAHPEPALRDRILNAEQNFKRLLGEYRETRLSGEEREVLARIDKDFANAVDPSAPSH